MLQPRGQTVGTFALSRSSAFSRGRLRWSTAGNHRLPPVLPLPETGGPSGIPGSSRGSSMRRKPPRLGTGQRGSCPAPPPAPLVAWGGSGPALPPTPLVAPGGSGPAPPPALQLQLPRLTRTEGPTVRRPDSWGPAI